MENTHLDFQMYVNAVCQYAFMEYDLGVKTEFAIIQVDMDTLEWLGLCWVSNVSYPDAARIIARKIQEHMEF